MKPTTRIIASIAIALSLLPAVAQVDESTQSGMRRLSCTSIMVGRLASTDGSVMTSHTCDSWYRTWMTMTPARDYERDTVTAIYDGRMHTTGPADSTKLYVRGTIPQARHTYRFLDTAYPCLNEKQLAMGETTIGGRDTLRNKKGLFMIEELARIALERCTTAREAIALMGKIAEQYGYGYTSIDKVTGEGKLEFVNDGMKQLMTKFREYYSKGYILTGGTYSESSYTSSLFTAGQMLFCIGSTAGATHQYSQDFATGVARLPRAAGKARKVISQGPSLGFLSHKKNNEIDQDRMLASWLFYKFFTETENATNWAITTDYLPIRYSVSETDDYLKYSSATGKTGEAVVKAATAKYGATEVGNDLYSSPVFRGSGEARNQANSLVVGCLSTDTSIDELFQKAYAETLKKM